MTTRDVLRRLWLELTGVRSSIRGRRLVDTCSIHYASGGRVLVVDPVGTVFEVVVLAVDPSDPDARLVAAFIAGMIEEG